MRTTHTGVYEFCTDYSNAFSTHNYALLRKSENNIDKYCITSPPAPPEFFDTSESNGTRCRAGLEVTGVASEVRAVRRSQVALPGEALCARARDPVVDDPAPHRPPVLHGCAGAEDDHTIKRTPSRSRYPSFSSYFSTIRTSSAAPAAFARRARASSSPYVSWARQLADGSSWAVCTR